MPLMLARPFLLDIDNELNYRFVDATAEAIDRANFLQAENLEFEAASERLIPMVNFRPSMPRRPVNFIFHTAFCGSTLLSRALHHAPEHVSLKEPNVLFRLSEASLSLRSEVLSRHLDQAMSELSQPWTEGGRVLIKPTNSCNRIAERMTAPGDKIVLLYSTLEEFMVSCLKKMPEAHTRLNWMARHLLPGSHLEHMLEVPRNVELNIIEACVLTWYVSLEYFSKLLSSSPADEVMVLRYQTLKQNPISAARSAGLHFGIPEAFLDPALLSGRLRDDAKTAGRPYDPERFRKASNYVYAEFGAAIEQGLRWADEYVAKAIPISNEFKMT